MYIGKLIDTSAIVKIATAQTTVVRMSTRRMPQTPIHRLVSGPAVACPMLVAASTRPAEAYEPVMA